MLRATFIVGLLAAACLSACSRSQLASPRAASTPVPANFTINSASVIGDSLLVELTYSGSNRHAFSIESNGMATKSLPPQLPVRIVDGVQGDFGRALISHGVALDLTPLRMLGQQRIALRIAGWDSMVIYSY